MDQLPKCDANYVPLTPINFLTRAAKVYGDRLSVVYEGIHFTWQQTYERCLRLADSLRSFNISRNDVVSFSIQFMLCPFPFLFFGIYSGGGVYYLINRFRCWLPTSQLCMRCTSQCPWQGGSSTPSTPG